MSPDRVNFRPENAYFRGEWVDFGPGEADF